MKIKIKFTDQPLGFSAENNCYLRALSRYYDVEFSDDPDYVLYGVFGTEFLNYPDKVRIFLATEPIVPNFNDCDYAIGMIPLSFGNRYFRQMPMLNYGEDPYYKRLLQREVYLDNAFDRKFCNFIYSNERNGKGADLRIQFCKKLQQYAPVDCPGPVLNNIPNAIEQRYNSHFMSSTKKFNTEWALSKLRFLRDYKFTIAFENTSMPGWTTEKLIHPFLAGSIPIYWGNPSVAEWFNTKAFVCFSDHDNDMDKVLQRIRELDQDKQQYMEVLNQPVFTEGFHQYWEDELAEFLHGVVDRGVRPFEKNPMGYQTMGATDFGTLCSQGKIGLRTIVKMAETGLAGWLKYKIKNGGQIQ